MIFGKLCKPNLFDMSRSYLFAEARCRRIPCEYGRRPTAAATWCVATIFAVPEPRKAKHGS